MHHHIVCCLADDEIYDAFVINIIVIRLRKIYVTQIQFYGKHIVRMHLIEIQAMKHFNRKEPISKSIPMRFIVEN